MRYSLVVIALQSVAVGHPFGLEPNCEQVEVNLSYWSEVELYDLAS